MKRNPHLVLAGLLSAAAPLVATAALAGTALAGPDPAAPAQRAQVATNTNCAVAVHALDQLKYPDCLGD
jgi:hypothetical protein